MLSRRTLMKYTGLAWLGGLFADCGAVADGGCEQLPTNIEGPNPWDVREESQERASGTESLSKEWENTLSEPHTAEQYKRAVYYPDGNKRT